MKRDVKDQAEAIDIVNKINNHEIGYLPIHWNPFVAGAVADAVDTPDPAGPDPVPSPPPTH
jgi:hypothetical protein